MADADIEHTGSAPKRWNPTGPQKVWALTAIILIAGLLVAFPLLDDPTLDASQAQIPWWALAIIVYLAELTVVHMRYHRHAQSFSMSEVPLVLGLFMTAPVGMLAAQLVGNAAALIINRRQPPVKLLFNLAQFGFQGALAIAAFRVVVGLGPPLGWAGWAAATVAMLMAVVVANVLISAAIRISGGRLDRKEQMDVLSLTLLAAGMNTSLALVGVTILWTAQETGTAWLAIVPPVVLFLSYRAYISQRTERSRLESLYQATRVLHEAPQLESALTASAEYAMEMFEADFVEIALLPDNPDGLVYRTAVGPEDRRLELEQTDLGSELDAWTHIAHGKGAVLIADPERTFPRSEHQIHDAIAAPLTGDGGVLGVILIANRLGDTSHFVESDVRLLETFAAQVSVSLENGRLEDSLAQLTELKEELRHQASHDSLTKLANRSLFTERVEAAIDRLAQNDRFVAVLFLDLDDFKTVNDSLGHAAGDELLVHVAARLEGSCRPEDVVARLGGDEFAVLLEDLHQPSDGTDVAERILRGLLAPFAIEGKDLTVRTSIGVAFGGHGEEASQLLRNADAAMYSAKVNRKGTYRVYEDEMHAEMIRRLELRADLTDAASRGELEVVYQPIIDLNEGTVSGFEALIRWNHPTRGVVPPNQFIPFAEETGLIGKIGKFVLRSACRQANEWRQAYPDANLSMAVNLSPRQLADVDVVGEVTRALRDTGLQPDRLILEITENVLMHTSARTLDDLRDIGVRLAIDDFGTGYSSLSYLDRLPIDIVKIDKSFVSRLNPDEESPLVRTVVQIGQSLGIETIVEGIETAHQLQRLQELGSRLGQGYFLATPMPAADIEALFEDGQSRQMIPPTFTAGRAHLRIIS